MRDRYKALVTAIMCSALASRTRYAWDVIREEEKIGAGAYFLMRMNPHRAYGYFR
jgi:hypothetical protein